MGLLATDYRALTPQAIWPLALTPISERPLFEHLDNQLIAKRSADIDRALSLVDNPHTDAQALINALEQAIVDAVPDLGARLRWRARLLLDRWLRHSAPTRTAAPQTPNAHDSPNTCSITTSPGSAWNNCSAPWARRTHWHATNGWNA